MNEIEEAKEPEESTRPGSRERQSHINAAIRSQMLADPTWNPRREQLEERFREMASIGEEYASPQTNNLIDRLNENIQARRAAVSQVRTLDNMIAA